MPIAPKYRISIKVPTTDESPPLDGEIFPFHKAILKVNGETSISRTEQYLAFLRCDRDKYSVCAGEKMIDNKVSVSGDNVG